MRKAGIGLLLLVFAGVVYWATRPARYAVSTPVNGEIFQLGRQLTMPASVIKWLQPFATSASKKSDSTLQGYDVVSNQETQARFKPLSIIQTEVYYQNNPQPFLFSIVASPDTQRHRIMVSYQMPRYKHWFKTDKPEQWALQSVNEFNSMMQDTRKLYGYDLTLTRVEDTAFLFTTTTCLKADLTATATALYSKLIAFSEQHNGGYYGVRIFYKQPLDSNNLKLFAAIAVTKNFDPQTAPGIEFKRMPYQKNLLMASYAGPYGEIDKVFQAMEQFKRDQGMASMAIPYEKLPEGIIQMKADDLVKRELFYPIF